MVPGTDHREGRGQFMQRRVSYRRLRDGALQDEDGVHTHSSSRHRHDDAAANGTNLSSRAALTSPRGPSSGTAVGVGTVHLGLQETRGGGGDAAGGDDEDDSDLMSLHASLSMPWPLWYEAWLAARDGAWFIFLATLAASAACLLAVVHLSSDEGIIGATAAPRLPARRIPSPQEQAFLHDSFMRGATAIYIGQHPVVLQGATAATKKGHLRLPNQFYQGIHFGLSAWDVWGEKLSDRDNSERNGALRGALEGLDPRPSAIYSTTFEGGVEGFTVAYLSGTLGADAKRSVRDRSDPVWSDSERAVLAAARQFQQLVVIKWHPRVWGPGHESDPDLHTSVLQEVKPTRTGLRSLASTVAVYHVQKAAPVVVDLSRPAAR